MEDTLKQILAEYNSIAKSRARWIRNRKDLKNTWPSLYKVLEEASGRDGNKLVVFDPQWHERADKGGFRGTANKDLADVEVLKPAEKETPAEKPKEAPAKKAETKKASPKKEVEKSDKK